MKRATPALCASCAKYPLEQAMNNGGRATCPSYSQERMWDSPASVLYEPAKNRAQRKEWVITLMQQQEDVNHGPQEA